MKGAGTPSREEIETQAARLIVALDRNPDAETSRRVAAWIGESPHHAVAFARAERAWDIGGLARGDDDAGDDATDAAPRPHGWLSRRRALGAMAATILAAGGGWLALRDPGDRYETGLGEMRTVPLADGSRLHLNTNSAVTVRMEPERRLLRMERGEAYFEVAHDARRPFDVVAGGTTFRALGTAFAVRMEGADSELTVTKGVVGVREAAVQRRVAAGNAATVGPSAVAVESLPPDALRQRMAWCDGMIEFNGDTLDHALAEFNRYRAQPIVVGDDRVGRMQVGGRFRTDESRLFLEGLVQTMPIRIVTRADGSITLLSRDDAVTQPAPAVPSGGSTTGDGAN